MTLTAQLCGYEREAIGAGSTQYLKFGAHDVAVLEIGLRAAQEIAREHAQLKQTSNGGQEPVCDLLS